MVFSILFYHHIHLWVHFLCLWVLVCVSMGGQDSPIFSVYTSFF